MATYSWVNGRVAVLLGVVTAALAALNAVQQDWLPAIGFGCFAVAMALQALDDLRWHGRHEPWSGRARQWFGATTVLVALLILGELLLA
ncbi:hypothetical protein EKO23_00735 [Nocardioides guangzhouensis]|uniref:Uncharacterized protein n=1 Tax=Nocardioides guangzhouensis TaxID=2497878 RepID=A0A4Q4ZKT6_9ACTN|nr:hypothetical protein [Nocardioides guangzhouensis]RYP88992.1 hypothetical protein EKO23_00735 [Nocardioides guangzhouensis]